MSQVVQSAVVNEFIKSKNEFFSNKEDLIKEKIMRLNDVSLDIKSRFLESSLFFGCFFTIWLVINCFKPFMLIKAGVPFDTFQLALVMIFLTLFCVVVSDFLRREDFKTTLKQLKNLLEPTSYETRIKFVSYFSSTLKIVVEGNVDLNGLVIKESSKHFTSYIETTNKVELVKNLVKIIEKQEKMFKVKE